MLDIVQFLRYNPNIQRFGNWIHSVIRYKEEVGSNSDLLCGLVVRVSGYKSWGPGFDSRPYQIFWEVGGLERGPLSLNEKVAAPVQKTDINGRGNSLRWPRNTLYPQTLALTSPTSGGSSVGIVRLRTTATEFSFFEDPTQLDPLERASICPVIKYSSQSVVFQAYHRQQCPL
jgi:hypothetical protein